MGYSKHDNDYKFTFLTFSQVRLMKPKKREEDKHIDSSFYLN